MASFQVEWKNSALKELEKLPRQIVTRVVAAVDELSDDPYPQGVRKLVGSEFSYRVRVGDYRVIYNVFQNKLVIEIVRVRHRKDAYK
mgnify:CR=1 FL=1